MRDAASDSETEALLGFLDVVAPSLRAGRSADDAIRLACGVVEDSAVVDGLKEAVTQGISPGTALARIGREHPDVALFARAWTLSSVTGCPLADTAECVAGMVRSRLSHRRRVATASSGARTSIRILMCLPLGGPVLALAVGVDPVAAYVASPAAWLGLLTGGVLVIAGRLWVERLISGVARGPVLGSGRS